MAASNSGEHNPNSVETLATGSIILLDEVLEGDHVVSRNYCFAPVGGNIPIGADFRYDPEAPPSQPLAVSQRFHLLFVVHSDGFCVVRTEDAIAAEKKIKEKSNGPSIQEICMVDIPLGKVSILALSSGDSLLTASVENQLHFFSISALLHKKSRCRFWKTISTVLVVKTSNSSNLGGSRSLCQSQIQYHDSLSMSSGSPLGTMQSNKNWLDIPYFSGKELGTSESLKSEKHTSSVSESDSYETSSFLAGAFGSNCGFSGKISQVKVSAINGHPVQTVSSPTSVQSSSSLSSSINLPTTSSSTKPSVAASSFAVSSTKWDPISQANTDANQKVSQTKALASSFTFPSTLSFPTANDDVLPYTNANEMNERSTSPEPASQSTVAFFGSKKSENPITESTISSSLTMGENLKALASVSQPELPTATSVFRPGQTMLSTPTTELMATLKSEHPINVGHITSPVMDLASNKKSEQPSDFQINSTAAMLNSEMSNDGKMGSLDVITDEDEMEEEAPESGLGAELSLGNLAGFGIGSAPNSTTVEPNPFGFGVMNKAATPVTSPFTPPAPTGELFRPASFSFQSQQSQPAIAGAFSTGFSTGSTPQDPTESGFGQPAQFGAGQKALGSVLGTFGQSRQFGTGLSGSGITSPTGFASGFPGMSSSGFGGFAAAATSSGGGFSSLATSGGVGFAAAATGAGGFAAATAGAGFVGAGPAGGGFAGAGFTGIGFGAFSNQQGGGGFSAFGNSSASGRPPELFTLMRK